MNSNWRRAGIGACTATAVALTAGLAFAPAAQAATTPSTGGLLGGVTSTVGGVTSGLTSTVNGVTTGVTNVVNGTTSGSTGGTATLTSTVSDLLNGLLTGTSTTSPVTVGTSNGVTVGVNGGNGTGVTVTLGGSGGTGATTTVDTGGTPTVPDTTSTTGGTPTSTGGNSTGSSSGGSGSSSGGASAIVTGLKIAASVDTVFPMKDGYRDTAVLHVTGTTATGKAAPVNGVVVVKLGSTEVKRWTIDSTTEDLTWDGLNAGRIVAGKYDVTGVAVDSTGNAVGATDSVSVSAKRLVTSSQTFRSKSVTGTHVMAAKAKAGLKHGKVLLRLTTEATGVVGKQYLVFSHKGKKLKVLIQNGTHTTKALAVPKSFTEYMISHTWKKGTVKLKSVQYHYKFKRLK